MTITIQEFFFNSSLSIFKNDDFPELPDNMDGYVSFYSLYCKSILLIIMIFAPYYSCALYKRPYNNIISLLITL